MTRLPGDYRDRVYAGWLGKCIGVRLGVPVEGWTADEIARHLGEIEWFLPLPPGQVFKPDDDTAVPLILIRALEDFGLEVTAEQMGETVLNYVADGRGTFWWGGYGVSSEHTAYANLAGGLPAPRSGSIALNGKTLAEQIGGQIFSDIWGLVAPNNPSLAASYAEKASSVTHDGEGINGGRFIAGLVSRAFSERDPTALVESGRSLIPPGSEYARVVRAMLEFHRQHPHDWRAGYRYLAENFGYDRYGGAVHIIPNAGVVALALLYGSGDFSRAVRIAVMAGWDTDCNAGNVGAIMGVAVGLAGLDRRWREPMNDVLVGAGLIGSRNLMDLPACADLFCCLGAKITGESSAPLPRYHFDYPGSTHGFVAQARLGEVLDLRQVSEAAQTGRGALQITVRNLKKKGEARAFVRLAYRPSELSGNNYGASFSPKLYPGQTITARVFLPPEAPEGLLASLFVWDDLGQADHQMIAEGLIPGRWHTLTYRLSEMRNVLLSRVGLVLRHTREAWSGRLLLDSLAWDGPARFSTDFSRERPEYGAISGWTFLRGYWRLEDGAYHGSGPGLSETYTGDVAWRNLALAVDLVPLAGEHHNVNVRVQGARRSYAVGLAPGERLVIYKNAGGYRAVAEARFTWRPGQRYRLRVEAVGPALAVAVDDQAVLRWTDPEQPYLHGQIGLSNEGGSHTRYERVEVKGLG